MTSDSTRVNKESAAKLMSQDNNVSGLQINVIFEPCINCLVSAFSCRTHLDDVKFSDSFLERSRFVEVLSWQTCGYFMVGHVITVTVVMKYHCYMDIELHDNS